MLIGFRIRVGELEHVNEGQFFAATWVAVLDPRTNKWILPR